VLCGATRVRITLPSGEPVRANTRPDTLAAALADSPSGLAAWLVEKYRAWSDCGGDLESRFSKDTLLAAHLLAFFRPLRGN
jgi:hypothetical protein